MEEFKKELLDLGFNINSIGFIYWLDMYELIKENKCGNRTMNYYIEIANKHQSTYARVERALRHSMEYAIENIKSKYNIDKINNSVLMNLIRCKFYE